MEGNFHVVLNDDHVQKVNGAFRVRLHSGGAAVGHARYYGSEWFKKNSTLSKSGLERCTCQMDVARTRITSSTM